MERMRRPPVSRASKEGCMESPGIDSDAVMDRLTRTIPPMDVGVAESLLLEAKRIMDEQGVVFFLRQGTCLGAIRDGAFIPWDDDLDIGSIFGLHGFKKESVEPVAAAFRGHGYHVRISRAGRDTWLGMMKHNVRIDWYCYRQQRGNIVHFPGVPIPVRLFRDLKEIDFLGERFLAPNPPEEYLRFKYGPDWMTPKRIGYEKDVVDNLPGGPVAGRPGRLAQFLFTRIMPRRLVTITVLDEGGAPVPGAEVTVVGLGRFRTNGKGHARFHVPTKDMYAVVVRFVGGEEVLYEEELAPGKTYVYRPDPLRPAGRIFVLSEE